MRNRMLKLADQSSHKKHRHAAWLRPHAEMFQRLLWCGPALSRYSFDATPCPLDPQKQTFVHATDTPAATLVMECHIGGVPFVKS